jgi:hypothetical protein
MRKLLLAAVVCVMASLAAATPAFAQYGPTPSSVAGGSATQGGAGGTGTGASGTGVGTGAGAAGTGTGTGGSGLAFTGSDLVELLLRVGIVLVAIGGIVLLLSRRRRFRTVGS